MKGFQRVKRLIELSHSRKLNQGYAEVSILLEWQSLVNILFLAYFGKFSQMKLLKINIIKTAEPEIDHAPFIFLNLGLIEWKKTCFSCDFILNTTFN